MNHRFPVLFGGSSTSATTRNFAARVAALNGAVTPTEARACDYLLTALRNQNQDPANVVVYAYLGGINGIVVPFLNRDGATGNATNQGPYVAGDLSTANGIAQSGTKHLRPPLTTAQMTVVGWSFAAYHSGSTTTQRVLQGGAGASNANIHSLEYRGGSAITQSHLHVDATLPVTGSATATTSGRIMSASASTTDFRLFRNGTQDGSTRTTARSALSGSQEIWLGGYNNNGAFLLPATANLCVHAFGCGISITPAQATAIDAIFREFLVRLGRNPCD